KHMWAAVLAAEDKAGTEAEAPPADPGAYDAEREILFVVDSREVEAPTHFRSRASARARVNSNVLLYQLGDDDAWTLVRFKREDVRQLQDPFDRQLIMRLFGVLLDEVDDLDPDEDFPEIDAEAGSMRVECSSFSLDIDAGAELARRLCETERFFLLSDDDADPVLIEWSEGSPWELGLGVAPPDGEEFEVTGFLARGEERCSIEAAPLLANAGVVVLESDDGPQASRFDAHGHFNWIEKLLSVPRFTMSAEEQGDFITRLVEDPEEPLVDLPSEWTRTDDIETPLPVLHMRSVDGEPSRRDGVACRLFFEYRGRRVEERHESASLCDLDRHEIYKRDPDAEEGIREVLRELPIEVVDPPSGHFDYKIPTESFHVIVQSLVDASWIVEARERRFRGEGKLDLRLSSGIDWFELQGELDFGDEVVPIADVLAAARKGENTVRLDDGTAGLIPAAWLTRFRLLNSMGSAQKESVRFRRSQGWMLDALLAEQEAVRVDEDFEDFRGRLASFEGIEPVEESGSFEGTLRDYQREGLGWIQFLREFELGGCLADDMGLGKT
ncbi:MAG: hypothetical protein AAF488_19735, partial [Planctomycetota bacterium]